MINTMRVIELSEEHIDLIIETLKQRHSDLTDLLKLDSAGFEEEAIQAMQLEQRDLNDIIRELVHYSELKTDG